MQNTLTELQEPSVLKRTAVVSAPYIKRQLVKHKRNDVIFKSVTFSAALLILLMLGATLFVLIQGSLPALQKFGFKFYTVAQWDPVAGEFGALVPIYGTIITSVLALLIAVPISFGIALFLTELSPRFLKTPLGLAIELLAAIPSVIYGMWGLFVFAPTFAKASPWITERLGTLPVIGAVFQGPPIGIGILTASFILAIMVIPFISAIMRDVFNLVPGMLKESAYGLGATTWETVWNVVLPHSRLGVVAGIMLGLGRALGETMAVTFVIGNSHRISASLLMPGSTISSTLANEFTEAVDELHTSSLIALGLALFVITFIVLAAAKMMLTRLEKQNGGKAI